MRGSGQRPAGRVPEHRKKSGQRVFYIFPLTGTYMPSPQRFCTACGTPLAAGMRFCSQCGQPVAGQGTGPQETPLPRVQPTPSSVPAATGGAEQVLGIVPFLEQGLLSVIHYTLVVTDRRLIFRTWNPGTDEAMSDTEDAVMEESCAISETVDEIAHFRQKDWSGGPWQQYRLIAPDAIPSGAPGTITVPLADIVNADIVCETRTSTQDKLYIRDGNRQLAFDLMYSQGPYLFRILQPLLGDRVSLADHLHRRRGLDRLISGQEYQ